MDFNLLDVVKDLLLHTARESLTSYLEERDGAYKKPSEKLEIPLGAFVTLHIHGRLRGCIGNIVPVHPLFTAIKRLARESAFHDPRFPALTPEELPETDIEISVLSPLKKISSVNEIEVGTHGILMKNGIYSGVLLPQVPVEQGWNLEEFLRNTCYKAGMDGNCYKDSSTLIEIFTAVIFSEN